MCFKKQYVSIRIFLLLIGIGFIQSLSADNVFQIGQYSVQPGTPFTVQLEAANSDSFVAFQVDIPIPNGFHYIDGSAQLNASRTSGQLLSVTLLSGDTLRLLGYSVNNTPFVGNAGTLVSFTLKSGTLPGNYSLTMNNALMGNSQSTNILTGTMNGQVTVVAPHVKLSATGLDFGRVPLETMAEQSFQITNDGNSDLVINSLSFNDASFSTTETGSFTITGGGNHTVSVKFAPLVKGTFSKQLQISSNDPSQPITTVNLNAVAYAVNEVHTGNMSGASSSTARLDFSVNNMEAFTGFQFDVNLPSPMTYVDGSAQLFRFQDHTVSVNKVNNNTLRVIAYSATNKNFTGNSGKLLSLAFSLMGTGGYYPINISNVMLSDTTGANILSASFGGALTITAPDINAPTQINFGDVSTTSSGTQNVRVWNYGQEPLIISQLTFSTNYFQSNQTLPITIQPSNYFDLPVQFIKSTKGAVTGTLNIGSNDPDENPFAVQLSANAFVPNYLLIKTQTVLIGDTIRLPIEIDNAEPFVAFQFDLTYPAGLTPDINGIALTNRKQDQVIATNVLSNNSLRIVAYSPGQKAFTGNEGPVLTIPFKSETTMLPGTYNVTFDNALISNDQSENILYSAINGTIQVSQATGVEILNAANMTVFPNPTKGLITLQADDSSEGIVKVDVYSNVGQLITTVEKAVPAKSLSIDLSSFHSGIYFLKIFVNGKVGYWKVLKQ